MNEVEFEFLDQLMRTPPGHEIPELDGIVADRHGSDDDWQHRLNVAARNGKRRPAPTASRRPDDDKRPGNGRSHGHGSA
jgi:hypothetical protein